MRLGVSMLPPCAAGVMLMITSFAVGATPIVLCVGSRGSSAVKSEFRAWNVHEPAARSRS